MAVTDAAVAAASDVLEVGSYRFTSRLFVGTGKYATLPLMREAIAASGSQLVTVALRRVDLHAPDEENLFHFLPEGIRVLPNTAGARTAAEAVTIAELARAAGLGDLVKLEIIGDTPLLWPDVYETLQATETLVERGFTVMVYTTPDPVVAMRLEAAGAHAVMPLGSPIGSGQGVLDVTSVRRIKERVRVPVVVDAGIGVPSDAALAMEAGADAVLINSAIALAGDPVAMARAMRLAVEAGRAGFLAGRMPARELAAPSSPVSGQIGQ
ncbi:hydroxyethylthiazole phosphate synthetase (thiamine biosynthesis) [Candidatus Hydrogenisulfobacillus filiaventi]|uniref:Thiazole synthase n=1 Tax=Candidatus Hydrogenisulfobacillus filiaventi TaxID=2707344 RepID=A0A6F8ZG34_9FIRM|nr:thiazole synthase [Bacillota bacterium]CAB1128841.1 hydroxyethylthiazole phosphate synthetase (thiamine biosynthesis) [Candidatus Hydrogenisulfobacillus filiaventi]